MHLLSTCPANYFAHDSTTPRIIRLMDLRVKWIARSDEQHQEGKAFYLRKAAAVELVLLGYLTPHLLIRWQLYGSLHPWVDCTQACPASPHSEALTIQL